MCAPPAGQCSPPRGRPPFPAGGKRLNVLAMAKAGPGHQLTVEEADGEYFISCGHEMAKTHFISFVAVLTGDTLLIKKLYPEWAMQARVPCAKGALLVWYCTQHGLFCQPCAPARRRRASKKLHLCSRFSGQRGAVFFSVVTVRQAGAKTRRPADFAQCQRPPALQWPRTRRHSAALSAARCRR